MRAPPRLIGVVHLAPLPGAPRYGGRLEPVVDAAAADARRLAGAGFDGIIVENYGDAPFFADDVPKATVAAMTRAVGAVTAAVQIPVGVNVLRNDAPAAMAIAAATGAGFVRVNVLTGTMATDQGVITGKAAELARLRAALAADVAVYADVFVKHAVPPAGLTLEQAAVDTVDRGLADAVIVTGEATGTPPEAGQITRVVQAVAGTPVLVGSGVTSRTVASVLEAAHGVIVGTSVKRGGVTTAPVDRRRAAAFARAAGRTARS